MSANTATKIPAITQIKGLPPLAAMALQSIKETLEVREGLHEPLDRFISVRELADLILDDEKIVTYLGSGHSHDARYYTETEWNLTAKGDLNVAQGAGVPGTLGVGDNNKLIRADSGATLGIEYFSLLGTSNQVTVTHNASDATLSLPQNIHSGASPTFTGLTLSGLTAGSVPFINAGGVIGENNSAFFFEEDAGYGKLAVGDSAVMRNTFQAVREDNILVLDNMKALCTVRNKGTTNNNYAGFSAQTLDTDGNVHSGARLISQFTSHALNAVSAHMIFETRHAGARSEKMRLSSDGKLTLSNIAAGVADYDKFIVSDAGVLKFRTGAEVLSDIGGAPYAFKTITGITNDVVADLAEDTLTLASANNLLDIVGTAATDTITFTVNQANLDHGSIGGLGDSADHTWALLVDGTRPLTADWNIGNHSLGINISPSYRFHLSETTWITSGSQRAAQFDLYPSVTLTGHTFHYGLNVNLQPNVTVGAYQYTPRAAEFTLMPGTSTVPYDARGFVVTAHLQHGTGTCPALVGYTSNVRMTGAGTVTLATGTENKISTYAGGTITDAIANYSEVWARDITSPATITTGYGFKTLLQNMATSTFSTGYLYYGSYSGTIGTKWGIYLSGETKNYFSGQVGIGTSTPNSHLDIEGSAPYITLTDTTNSRTTKFGVADGYNAVIDHSSGVILFKLGATERARIDTSGLLLANGYTVRTDEVRARDSGGLYLRDDSGTMGIYIEDGGLVRIQNTEIGSSQIQINTYGTGNRYAYIDFVADNTYTDYALRIVRGNSGANSDSYILHRGTGFLALTAQDAGYIYFATSNIARMKILSGGNVGVGNITPTALLDINSDILRLRTAKTPASASAAGNAGDICWDASNIYVCVAANTWKKVAIATW